MKISGNKKSLIILIITFSIPLFLITYLLSIDAKNTLEDQIFKDNKRIAKAQSDIIGSYFDSIVFSLCTFSFDPTLSEAVKNRDEKEARGALARFIEQNPRANRVLITDLEGNEWADYPTSPNSLGKNYAYRDWYRRITKDSKQYISEIYKRAGEPQVLVIAIASPVFITTNKGSPGGYLVAQIVLKDFLADMTKLNTGISTFVDILDHSGFLIGYNNEGMESIFDVSKLPLYQQVISSIDGTVISSLLAMDGSFLITYSRIPGSKWSIVVSTPKSVVFQSLIPMLSHIGILMLFGIVGIAAIGYFAFAIIEKREIALEKNIELSKELNAMKEQQSRLIAHDLRNPLAAIVGWLDILKISCNKLCSPEVNSNSDCNMQVDAIDNALKSADSLVEMIDDLVDINRMKDKNMSLNIQTVLLNSFLDERMSLYTGQAQAHNLELLKDFKIKEITANIDPGLFRRVVDNLLSNAIKHTPSDGKITVGMEKDNGRVIIYVKDTGEGIPPEYHKKIFDEYVAAEIKKKMGTTRDTGLGLVFCRLAVEQHGGTIRVESEDGKGSKFIIELPVDRWGIIINQGKEMGAKWKIISNIP